MAASLTGDQATFTWTANSSGMTVTLGTTADFDRWEATGLDRVVDVSRPFGWLLPKVTVGGLHARGRVYFECVSGTKPPVPTVPSGTYGLLTLYLLAAGLNYAFKAVLFDLQLAPNSTQGGKIRGSYAFMASGDTSTDTIT